jgi:tRNA pseudouridine38-40 synthase
MTRYKIILEYCGTNLIGFQANKDGDSVQSLVSDAIFKFCNQRVEVVGAGRTDSGVHALGMACHFDIGGVPADAGIITRALNFYLTQAGASVAVLYCQQVSDNWHARFDCVRRNYKYIILNRRAPVVLDKDMVWWIPRPLDIGAMQAAAEKLVGNHDFTSFRASECQAKSPVKTLDKAEIEICDMAFGETGKMQGQYIIMNFSAKSFLHHQVRNMVGTLVEIGLGKSLDIDEIFAARDRGAAGPTASAGGLYFVSAEY